MESHSPHFQKCCFTGKSHSRHFQNCDFPVKLFNIASESRGERLSRPPTKKARTTRGRSGLATSIREIDQSRLKSWISAAVTSWSRAARMALPARQSAAILKEMRKGDRGMNTKQTKNEPNSPVAAVQCDRMCSECSSTCTRDWGHNGPHRCDRHARN